jgi:hypothetical protein
MNPGLIRVPVAGTFIGMQTSRLVLASLCAAVVLASVGCRTTSGAEKPDVVSGASIAGGDSPAISGEVPMATIGKRVLVVYFSQGNATKRVAEDIAVLFGADIERVVEKKQRKGGFFGIMGAGAASSMSRATPIEPPVRDPSTYEAVVVCTPIWAWHLSPPMRSWLRLNKGKLPRLTAYVTVSHDTDPAKVVAAMARESGRQPIAFTGFADRDFEDGNRVRYLEKIGSVVEHLR